MGKVTRAKDMEPEYGTPDEENPEWTKEDFEKAVPFPVLAQQMGWKVPGRPKAAVTKVPVNLRLDPKVVAHFKAGGPGWQTRINATLLEAVDASGTTTARKPAAPRKRKAG